jgi:hypothetical protein
MTSSAFWSRTLPDLRALVFDNRMGVPEDPDVADPQQIAGGSIVIHKA